MQHTSDFVVSPFDLRQAAQVRRDGLLHPEGYPEGTAGYLMTSEYSCLDAGLTASQAIDMLRREAADAETIYQSYVLDEKRNLLGSLSLRELILAAREQPIEQLMVRKVICVCTSTRQE